MGLLEGQLAVVTGGGSGIGRATCERFVAEGARVVVLDVDGDRAQEVASALDAHAVVADVADADACAAAIAESAQLLGGLTVLVNNAGTGNAMPLHKYPDQEWDRIVAVNLSATFYGIRAAVPLMREHGGSIVNNASFTGVRPTRFEGPYSAAKAGVINLTMNAALEYAPKIRVNCVSPGFIDTAMTSLVSSTPVAREALEAATPLARMGTAEDVANVITFLASSQSAYVTGQNLIVDGGSCLPNPQVDSLLTAFVSGRARSGEEG